MSNRLVRVLLGSVVGAVLIVSTPSSVVAQGATVITGRVTNEAGAPVASATVAIDLLKVTTATRDDGTYTLTVPAGRSGPATMTVRRIGFKSLQRQVTLAGAPMAQTWTLEAQAVQLTGVVVTALSISREKSTIGTSQQEVSAEDLTRTQTPNVISAISGKVSGVSITGNGNMGGSARIVIRGQGSILGNNQPLFIVDGIPVSNAGFSTASAGGGRDYGTALADLSAADISSMTVLKGPNAAALYGSRASNGAVVITTKSGRSLGDGVKFSFTSRMTADMPSVMPKYQNQYGQGFGGEFQYVDGAGSGVNDGADESWGPKLDGRLIDQFFGKQQPWIPHPNNVRDYFQTGSSISNSLQVAGSGRMMNARLSLTRENVKGIVPNSSLSKLAAGFSAGATVNDRLTLGATGQWVQNGGLNRPENGYTEGNPFMTFTWFGRQVDVQSLKSKYFNASNPYGLADGSLYNWNDNYHRNPYWQQYDNPAPDSRERFIGQINANYVFTSWLSGLVRTGNDSWRNVAEEHFAAGNIDRASASFNGGFTVANSRANESNFEGLLTAKKATRIVDLTATFGGSLRRNDQWNDAYNTAGILVPGIYNLSNAGIAPTFTNSEFHSQVNSAYGSVVGTFKQMWTVEVTGRNDWSSTLPKANASYFYPSISTSLVLSDIFPSIANNTWLTYAKLRGGWAQVGADAGAYQLQTLYNGNSAKFSGLPLYSLSNTSANAFLKPERTTGTEGGIEVSMFNDRVTLDASYYLKVARDQIMNLTVAPATGFSTRAINAGQISNRGVEAMVTLKPVWQRNGLMWTTTFNYTRNRNKVDALAPGLSTIIIASQWGANIEARAGEPYGVIFGYGWNRDSTGQLLLDGGLPVRNPVKKILGNVNPNWVGGWGNELRYKNYTMNLFFDIRSGGQNFSIGNWWGMYSGVLESTLKGREVDWNKPGLVVKGIDVNTGKANTVVVTAEDYGHNLYPTHEPAILNTGFVKLREMKVSWEAPASVASRFRLSQLNLALVGRNLWTKTDFPNYDPENSSNAGNGGQGFDMGAMSTTRTIGFNIIITP
jgi:TonB-linked SusC/RagA family outer membrane protein